LTDYIATIKEGDELLLDYGDEWEEARQACRELRKCGERMLKATLRRLFINAEYHPNMPISELWKRSSDDIQNIYRFVVTPS
jgi:hypothetical protein